MGIKFYCPKGHKLNVKDFLAGKKGACPHCGAQFIIPLQSRPKGDKTPVPELVGAAADADGAAELPAVTGASAAPTAAFPTSPMPGGSAFAGMAPAAVIPASSGSVPVGMPISPMGTAPVAVAASPAVSPAAVAPVVFVAPSIAPSFTPSVRPAQADPIDESPQAVWYVRPPSGGQYGPAKGDVMRRWTAEGRVSADSLVWREGWADWKPANQVFPSLATPPAPAPVGAAAPVSLGLGGPSVGVVVKPASSVDSPISGAPRGAQARRKSNSSMGMVIVIMLGLMAVILLAALLYIIMRG